MPKPGFATAARFWIKLGFISFGGPAGQIAIMHREIVVERGWLDERSFTGALIFCMLLPGPEALQLANVLGWKMHGTRGGLVAGLGFIVPSVLLLFALSTVYVYYGRLPWLEGVLFGLKAAVIALVVQALVRIGRRALRGRLHVALALGAFVALEFFRVPFPIVLLVAALLGAATTSREPHDGPAVAPPPLEPARRHTLRVASVGLVLWFAPLLWLAPTLGLQSLWSEVLDQLVRDVAEHGIGAPERHQRGLREKEVHLGPE